MVTSHAVETPTTITPLPTPIQSHRVFVMYSASTVEERWRHVSLVPPEKMFVQTLMMGAAVSAPISEFLLGTRDYFPLLLGFAALVLWKHRVNLARLKAGTEPKIGKGTG